MGAINKYPTRIEIGYWLKELFISDPSIVVSIKESMVNKNKLLSNNLKHLNSNFESINQTKVVDIPTMEYEKRSL